MQEFDFPDCNILDNVFKGELQNFWWVATGGLIFTTATSHWLSTILWIKTTPSLRHDDLGEATNMCRLFYFKKPNNRLFISAYNLNGSICFVETARLTEDLKWYTRQILTLEGTINLLHIFLIKLTTYLSIKHSEW